MMTTRARYGAAAAVACLLLWNGSASAQDAVEPSSEAAAAQPQAPDASAGLLGGRPLPSQELDGRRGGTSAQNDMRLDGVVGSNHASNLVTGANTISSGSFAGSAGLPMVIQNSGNNVLIQNATIVNVQIK